MATLLAYEEKGIVLGITQKILGIATMVLAAMSPAAAEPAEYEPNWESLVQAEPSEWLQDAKFGIYTHWGVYSVPAFQTEWYPKHMYNRKHAVYKHHVETYGDPKEFGYRKFVPLFKAEHWDPADWAALIKASGAKYAGMAVVHHDGFLLWDSEVNRWNAGNMGPKRDCFGEYSAALRAEGLKTIATFHHIRSFNWYLPGVGGLGGAIDPELRESILNEGWDLTDPEYSDLYWNELGGATYEEFLDQWESKVREVIVKYEPDVLWFDGGYFQENESENIVLDLLAFYHNQGLAWGKPVDVLNKLPSTNVYNFPYDYGFLHYEEGRDRPPVVGRPWIDDQRVSNTTGWCYVEGQGYRDADEILDGLIDRTSRGGGLLFNFSPRADGTVPEEQKQTMLGVGDWLGRYGESIYGTRSWIVYGEGDDSRLEPNKDKGGNRRKWSFADCGPEDVRFTRSKDNKTIYVLLLGWPGDGVQVTVESFGKGKAAEAITPTSVTMLGSDATIAWDKTDAGLVVTMPDTAPGLANMATVLKLDL